MATLYKHKVLETRKESGFLNSVMVDDAFVIGANRNTLLSKGSVIIFILTVCVILFHGLARILTIKR